jgi:hypothetical protein
MVSSLSVVWQNQRVPQRVQRVHQRLRAVAFSRILRMTCPTQNNPEDRVPKSNQKSCLKSSCLKLSSGVVKPEVLSQVVLSQVVVWSRLAEPGTQSPKVKQQEVVSRLKSSSSSRLRSSQVSSQVVVLKLLEPESPSESPYGSRGCGIF